MASKKSFTLFINYESVVRPTLEHKSIFARDSLFYLGTIMVFANEKLLYLLFLSNSNNAAPSWPKIIPKHGKTIAWTIILW